MRLSNIENTLAIAKSYEHSKTESSNMLKTKSLEKAIDDLLEFVENGSLIKIIFNFKTIINLIKEILNMARFGLR